MAGRLGRVGPYALLERLGRGGMGEVYLAANRRGEHVALKMLRDPIESDPDARLRLEREVRALRRVESPYVARVLDADLAGDRPYLVMEYIEGNTLLDAVRRGPLPEAELIPVAQGLATALAIIHAGGVVHRDVKPANVLIGEDGPVLIDFGIAQVHDATRMTMTGTFLGTPGYSAPELFADEAVGEPADVHAWAATVAFAATGRPTFGRGTAESQMYAILNGKADLAGVPAALLPLVRAALHRDPVRRPTAALLADRLTRLARATIEAPSRTAPAAAARRIRSEASGKPMPKADKPTAKAEKAAAKPEASPAKTAVTEVEQRPAEAPEGERPEKSGRAGKTEKAGNPGNSGKPGRSGRAGKTDGGPATVPAAGPVRRRGGSAGGRGRRAGRPAGESRTQSALAVETPPDTAGSEQSLGIPTGNAALAALAVLAVPCVVLSVIYPLATVAITAVFVVVTRAGWLSHWVVRNRRSARMRGLLRVLSFPLTLLASLITAAAWPGLPAATAGFVALWLTAGTHLEPQWWTQTMPVTIAGVVFGVICGGIIGREIERACAKMPGLRSEGLRALAVLGGFVALCAAAVHAVALFF
ncbi:serine/threonine-protein kinase [Sphaerimonospora sp. CA-214678]|uniref:serine/threonine-protein kinase n=1 Tax=Sphaerimonospora sp. CA-214678 TaxID=3240029 RepID=UPI003D939B3D